MKTNKFFSALLMGLAVVACTPKESGEAAQEPEKSAIEQAAEDAAKLPKALTAKDFKSSKSEIDSVSYLLGVNFGSFLKSYDFGSDLNYSQMIKGMKDFVNAKGNPRDADFTSQFKINPEAMNELFNAFLQKRQNLVALTNKEAGEKFLAANAKKDGVQVTESGLQYIIVEPGNDVKPSAADTVSVHYVGTLLDGSVFDQTEEGADAVTFTLSRVVPGWSEGLQLIGEGGKIKLFIPSNLAYGETGNQVIQPNSTLIFDVTLDKVAKVAEPEAKDEK